MTSPEPVPALISAAELFPLLKEGRCIVLDATAFVPANSEKAQESFKAARIPGAHFFDIDQVCDTHSPLPHMLPSSDFFAQAIGQLGIGNNDWVVLYDTHGFMSAPRAWWTFRVFGHERLSLLNGGLPAWQRAGYKTESGPTSPLPPQSYKASFNPVMVKDWHSVLNGLHQTQLIDFRPAERFEGKAPEPRPGLRTGHIPDSMNLPWARLLDTETKTLLPPDELKQAFLKAGLNFSKLEPDNRVTLSCGSGMTACMGAFALHLLGIENTSVYDGSWAEWGARSDLPIDLPVEPPVEAS
jgi:thiosulfate/3-mercaptopyruvate sulfurtransferase